MQDKIELGQRIRDRAVLSGDWDKFLSEARAECMDHWAKSNPKDTAGREVIFHRVSVLDRLREEIESALTSANQAQREVDRYRSNNS